MYFPPKSSRPGAGQRSWIGAVLVAAFAAFVVVNSVVKSCGGGRGGPGPSSVSTGTGGDSSNATVEEIRRQLEAPAGIERRDGTALAVLVDTSGSMREEVGDVGGGRRPKMDIAVRCLLDLVARCGAFATAHADKQLLLGIYEFSERNRGDTCRRVMPMDSPDVAAAQTAVQRMRASGDTPIGDAMIVARKDLNRTGLAHTHILVITDGENNRGVGPEVVAQAIAGLPDEDRSSVYFIAFDVAASRFDAIRDAGGLVLPASSGTELEQALDYILTGKILAEQPATPAREPR